MMRWPRPESTNIAYGGLAGAILGSTLCAGVAPAVGYPDIYTAAWIAMAALSTLSLCCAHHRRWLTRGWPVALAIAALAVCAAGEPAALVCGSPCCAAVTVCCSVIRRDTAARRWQ